MSQTPLPAIKNKVLTFHQKMNKVKEYLEKDPHAPKELKILAQEMTLQFYIDKPAITRLINISMQKDFEQFGVFFGLEDATQSEVTPADSFGKLTACFLGLNKDRSIIGAH